jgi:putative ABC transport system substrate-binding protein
MMIDTLGLVAGDKVGVIYCSSESNSVFQYNAVKTYLESKGIVVGDPYTFSEISELQATITRAASECKAIFVPSDNTVSQNEATVDAVCREAKTPVFTSYGGEICYCSLAIDYYDLGYRTGEMAAEILLGTKTIRDIEIETLTPAVAYNEELCALLGITIPEN